MLVDGVWRSGWKPAPAQEGGRFVRPPAAFRHWVTPDGEPGPTGEGGFPAEAGRYHLYVALLCPWASRALGALKLKRLEPAVSVSIVEPVLGEEGWTFGRYPGATPDRVNGARHLHQIYTLADPHHTGRATVPVLWDRARRTIVSNESAEIARMFDRGFGALADDRLVLFPDDLAPAVEALNARLYAELNDGVYRAGFAASQQAYDEAVAGVFAMLDELEARLAGGGLMFGDRLTASDLFLFVTLVRFDAAYFSLFKCNLRRIADYPALSRYLGRLLAIPELAATVNLDHIKRGYWSMKALNPSGIVPAGPLDPFGAGT